MNLKKIAVLTLSVAALTGSSAFAAFKFEKPVTVIVPFAAGGTSDLQIRQMQPYLEKELGTNLVVVNIKGGSGVIGTTQYLNDYKADGYSILYTLATPVVYRPLTGTTSYNYDKDLKAVSRTMSLPMYLIVSDKSRFKSAREIIDYIKSNPGKFTYANVGNGGNGHLAFASFLFGAGLKAKSVPYAGGTAECYTAMMGGEVDAAVYGEANLIAQADCHGAINLGSKSTVKSLRTVPTLAELGYEGYETNNLGGFLYQKGVPVEAVETFDAAVKAVLENSEFLTTADKTGFTPAYANATDFEKIIRQCSDNAAPIMKELGYGKKKK
ncbi:Bug family tripartite tricarboxylate transporter substrate binding protein [Pyramidobacter piscolens]|uniref:Bug family tripartite tricarboxylate transporter substrate binding protein n=1 Tax=Pyramidobacter piscolens TaxID=638849 RepID=UPI0026E02844|nr:tripartite tricarboxylate transporter substrate binding protein [Pyramidobacter piscolens]